MRAASPSRSFWFSRLANAFGSLASTDLLTDLRRLGDRDLADFGARQSDTGRRADRGMAALRSKGFGPIF